jgi:hypothetical protein
MGLRDCRKFSTNGKQNMAHSPKSRKGERSVWARRPTTLLEKRLCDFSYSRDQFKDIVFCRFSSLIVSAKVTQVCKMLDSTPEGYFDYTDSQPDAPRFCT